MRPISLPPRPAHPPQCTPVRWPKQVGIQSEGLKGQQELRLLLTRCEKGEFYLEVVKPVGVFAQQTAGGLNQSVYKVLCNSRCLLDRRLSYDLRTLLLPMMRAQDIAASQTNPKLGLEPKCWKMWLKLAPGSWVYQAEAAGQAAKVIGIKLSTDRRGRSGPPASSRM